MHDLYPQKQPPTVSAVTWAFAIASFLPPLALCWYVGAMAPDKAFAEWWFIAVPLVVAVVIGVVLGCWVSSDLPVGCAILLSPLIPTVLWFVFGVIMAAWSQNKLFSWPHFWMWMWPLIALVLSTPTAGVFLLTHWIVKGRG